MADRLELRLSQGAGGNAPIVEYRLGGAAWAPLLWEGGDPIEAERRGSAWVLPLEAARWLSDQYGEDFSGPLSSSGVSQKPPEAQARISPAVGSSGGQPQPGPSGALRPVLDAKKKVVPNAYYLSGGSSEILVQLNDKTQATDENPTGAYWVRLTPEQASAQLGVPLPILQAGPDAQQVPPAAPVRSANATLARAIFTGGENDIGKAMTDWRRYQQVVNPYLPLDAAIRQVEAATRLASSPGDWATYFNLISRPAAPQAYQFGERVIPGYGGGTIGGPSGNPALTRAAVDQGFIPPVVRSQGGTYFNDPQAFVDEYARRGGNVNNPDFLRWMTSRGLTPTPGTAIQGPYITPGALTPPAALPPPVRGEGYGLNQPQSQEELQYQERPPVGGRLPPPGYIFTGDPNDPNIVPAPDHTVAAAPGAALTLPPPSFTEPRPGYQQGYTPSAAVQAIAASSPDVGTPVSEEARSEFGRAQQIRLELIQRQQQLDALENNPQIAALNPYARAAVDARLNDSRQQMAALRQELASMGTPANTPSGAGTVVRPSSAAPLPQPVSQLGQTQGFTAPAFGGVPARFGPRLQAALSGQQLPNARLLPALGAPQFRLDWNRLLPSEQEVFQRQVEEAGFPLADYMRQLGQQLPRTPLSYGGSARRFRFGPQRVDRFG